ncbi:sugar ABC transporter permease [Quadrisphaera setariae]|uniref:Sugar ABC transporter permease n=1 Tax=Quadrisphaera setariae TaxID=2593304 RepID=A0A5C8ZEV4_9ACTN|nr:sugar ABC transporter permease [Quadrisphaera setariae]
MSTTWVRTQHPPEDRAVSTSTQSTRTGRVRGRELPGRNRRRQQPPSQPSWFLVPAFVLLTLFFLVPSVYNFVYAFTDWSSFKSAIGFVGLRNFENVAKNGVLLTDLRTTVLYAAGVAVFQNLFGLGLALLLEADTRLNRFARTMFFIPVVMSALAVGYIFQALLKPEGALNALIGLFTGGFDYAWLADTRWTLLWVVLIHSWKWMGLAMIIYLAGLKTISGDVLEASRLDGASRWQTFRLIRFPLLAPALTFNVATALLGSMNSFDIVQATTGGGPAQKTEILNIFIYRTFGQGLFAQATTMSLVLFITIAVMAFPTIYLLRRRERVL